MMGRRRVMRRPEMRLQPGVACARTIHLLRKIDRFIDLSGVRAHLGPYYGNVGPALD